MEFVFEEEVLENFINKCRCCFRVLLDEQKFIQITQKVERSFFELTQIKLVETNIFSNKICQLCRNDLEAFSQFRQDMSAKQNALYRLLRQREPEFAASIFNMKNEKNDIIEVNCLNEDDSLFQPQVLIKSEIGFDISPIENESQVENQWLTKTEQTFPCNSCDFYASTSKNLRKHIRADHGLNKLRCDICPYETTDKFDLEEHVELHTSKEPQSYYCEFCSKEFNKRHLLNRHIKLKHTEKERSHQCPTCDKSFFTISTLKKHVESHRAKDMPCEFCGKLFSCMNNLRTHLYYHAEPKFVCEFEGCGKKFFMRKLLKAHMNVHRGQKDFSCSYCEKSYFFQSHLKRHIISTHMKLKIDCEVVGCSSSFARKETYRNHVINHHQNIGQDNLHNLLTKIRNMKVEEYRCVGLSS